MYAKQSTATNCRQTLANSTNMARSTKGTISGGGGDGGRTSLPWTARERVDLDKMEKYVETTESIQVEVSELEHFLLGPEDADVSIRSLAENARDEGGYSKFVLLSIPRGKGGGG